MRQKKRIGVVGSNYNVVRNISQHEYSEYEIRQTFPLSKLTYFALGKLGIKRKLIGSTFIPSFDAVDLYHLWGSVSPPLKPWVVTTSHSLPFNYAEKAVPLGIRFLESNKCKRIIFTSNFAREAFKRKLLKYCGQVDHLIDKSILLLPPQRIGVKDWHDKHHNINGEIRLTIVGGHFFRKGGMEVLKAFSRVVKDGAPLTLTIVSALAADNLSGAGPQDTLQARKVIEANPRIRHIERLPNDKVMELFKHSHLVLLPSYVETFGYTVLEAQSMGCPVVTCDTFAFPEINGNDAGWQISVPKDQVFPMRSAYKSVSERAELSLAIEDGLVRVFDEIIADRSVLSRKSKCSLERIRQFHDPEKHREVLRTVYQAALGS